MHSLSHLKDSVDFAKINWLNLFKSALVVAVCFSFSWLHGSICFSDIRLYQADILIDCLSPFLALAFLFTGRRFPYTLGLMISAPFWLFSCFAPVCIAGAALFSFNKLTRTIGIVFFALFALVSSSIIYSHFTFRPIFELCHQKRVGDSIVSQYRANLWSDQFCSYDICQETPIVPGLVFSKGVDDFDDIDSTEFEVIGKNQIRYYSEGQPKTITLD